MRKRHGVLQSVPLAQATVDEKFEIVEVLPRPRLGERDVVELRDTAPRRAAGRDGSRPSPLCRACTASRPRPAPAPPPRPSAPSASRSGIPAPGATPSRLCRTSLRPAHSGAYAPRGAFPARGRIVARPAGGSRPVRPLRRSAAIPFRVLHDVSLFGLTVKMLPQSGGFFQPCADKKSGRPCPQKKPRAERN